MKKYKLVFAAIFFTISIAAKAQSKFISLDSCYVLARENYPLIKQESLIAKTSEYTLENISKGFLPQININGQATYQSDVTQLPKTIPGVPVLTKDQYKIYAEIDQPIYDGGAIKAKKEIEQANTIVNEQKLEVELYKLKDRINQLYFGVLLIDEQLKQNGLMKNDIQLGLDKINAQIVNGTALRSNADILKAEFLKTNQQTIELNSNRKALTDMLGLFMRRVLNEDIVFIKPENRITTAEIKRPELLMFDYQNKYFDSEKKLVAAENHPRISFFVQSGFGKPAFNILSNNFDPFYIGGLRFTFPLTGFYSVKNNRALIDLKKENIDVEKETFLFNTNLAVKQQNAGIVKFEQFLKTDDEIILLRTNVKKAALAQLENGTMNSSDYLREVNAEDIARENKILHEIQLLMSEYSLENTVGD